MLETKLNRKVITMAKLRTNIDANIQELFSEMNIADNPTITISLTKDQGIKISLNGRDHDGNYIYQDGGGYSFSSALESAIFSINQKKEQRRQQAIWEAEREAREATKAAAAAKEALELERESDAA